MHAAASCRIFLKTDDKTCGEMAELAEGARLEIVCASKAYRGFESLSLRHVFSGLFEQKKWPDPKQLITCELRQVRKEATVAGSLCVWCIRPFYLCNELYKTHSLLRKIMHDTWRSYFRRGRLVLCFSFSQTKPNMGRLCGF